jgi:RND family efflux transporter MFP subunit
VAVGVVVAELDTARLQARRRELEAALERAEADRALAESTLTRVREATEQRAASAQRLDEAKQSLAAARARVNEVTAQLDSIDVDLDKSVLRAPYAGIVARRHVDEGDVVAAGAPVVKLLEQADPEVRIGVDANAAEGLRVGDVHPLTIRGRQVDAAVEAVLPQRADGSRTVEARFVITGRLDGRIRAGDVAELTLDRRVTAEGVWLPLDALTESARGLWAVYVAADRPSDAPAATDAAQDTARDATRTLRRADVELLHHTGERVFVRGPFDGRTRVVVDGLHRLVPGQTVRLAAPESPGPNDGSGGVPQSARVGDASSGDLDRE